MLINPHLRELGVHDDVLTATDREELQSVGARVLENHMAPKLLAALQDRFDEVVAEEAAAGVPQREEGARTIENVVDKGEIFARVFTDQKVLAAANEVIRRPFKLLAFNARSALPGHGLQGLHADWGKPVEPGDYAIVNSLWLLDDFTADNGATRYVPGSHASGRLPADDLDDVMAPHPDERKVIAPAGSVAIINAHVWHGGTPNQTSRPRRVLHCAFVARDHPQHLDLKASLSATTLARLTPPERWLLDV